MKSTEITTYNFNKTDEDEQDYLINEAGSATEALGIILLNEYNSLRNINISHNEFKNISFKNIDFSHTDMDYCVFNNCLFSGCTFNFCSMENVEINMSRIVDCEMILIRSHDIEFGCSEIENVVISCEDHRGFEDLGLIFKSDDFINSNYVKKLSLASGKVIEIYGEFHL